MRFQKSLLGAAVLAIMVTWASYAAQNVAHEVTRPLTWAIAPHTISALHVEVNRQTKADRLATKRASQPAYYNGPSCSFLSQCGYRTL